MEKAGVYFASNSAPHASPPSSPRASMLWNFWQVLMKAQL